MEDHRRSYDISKSTRGGAQRHNGPNLNITTEERRDHLRNVHRSNDNHIPSQSTSTKGNRGYEEETRSRHQEHRKYSSGKNNYSPPSHPPANPLPSTSYATSQSNGDTEYNRIKTSRRNMTPSSASKMVLPYPVSHSKSLEVSSNNQKEYYRYSNSPTRDNYRSAEKNSRLQDNNAGQNRNVRNEKDNDRRVSQKSAVDNNKRISANEFQRNIDKKYCSKSKNVRSRSFDRDQSPINIHPVEYRRRSSEKGNIYRSKNDMKENSESAIGGERRQPLMSQREAFHRQQSKRHSNDDNHFTLKDSNAMHFQDKHIFNDEGSIKYSRGVSSENQTSNSTNHVGNHNSFHSEDNKESSTIRKSSKTRHDNPRSPRQPEKVKSKYTQNSKTEKAERNIGHRRLEISDDKEIKKEKFYDKYDEHDIMRQTTLDRDTDYSDLITKYKYEHRQSEKKTSEVARNNRKRPLSHDRDEENPLNKKSKHHSGFHPKGKKSAKSPNYEKSSNNDKNMESNISKDSDIDSASSETKRVSALSRLGPKITLTERLSKLPESINDPVEQPKHDSTALQSKNEAPQNSRLSMKDEVAKQYEDR